MNSYHLNIAIACKTRRLLLCLGALSYDLESDYNKQKTNGAPHRLAARDIAVA